MSDGYWFSGKQCVERTLQLMASCPWAATRERAEAIIDAPAVDQRSSVVEQSGFRGDRCSDELYGGSVQIEQRGPLVIPGFAVFAHLHRGYPSLWVNQPEGHRRLTVCGQRFTSQSVQRWRVAIRDRAFSPNEDQNRRPLGAREERLLGTLVGS